MGRTSYEPPRMGRKHVFMSQEDKDRGKPTVWDEIEIKGEIYEIRKDWRVTLLLKHLPALEKVSTL